uniref:Radial spoke head protein 9 homolog n=1 Tax=Malurus cyaneus samueli TaxID=2593467 RepID=A0A8C5UG70_9PASS
GDAEAMEALSLPRAGRRAALSASLPLLQPTTASSGSVWGCIQGVRGAYYIAEGLGPDRAAARSRLYSLNCLDWSLLTPATKEMLALAEQLQGRFQGDPSFEYDLAEVNAEAPVMKEEARLIATIEQIDKEVGIVPRGAFVKTPLGSVHENRHFEGLSLAEAKKLSSYFHFTKPVNLKNKTLLEKADLDPSIDFLDSLEHDIPRGSWSIQLEKGGTVVVLRSLLWLGLTFYHVPMTKQFGYVYFGTGEKNLDLPFML